MLQNNPELKSKIDQLWNKFWSGGISNPLTAIEQITYLLFMKRLDGLDQDRQAGAEWKDETYVSKFEGSWIPPEYRSQQNPENFAIEKRTLRWSEFKHMQAEEMLQHVQGKVFPFLKDLNGADSNFTHHMKNAVFIIPKPALLVEAVKTIDEIYEIIDNDAEQKNQAFQDIQGDVYEMLLSEIATAGRNGQFRTPRQIIKLMADLVQPQLGNKIADPACGSGGFLLGAYQYIVTQLAIRAGTKDLKSDEDGFVRTSVAVALTESAKTILGDSLWGYDIDATMVRLGLMNLMMHGIDEPHIDYKDTLSKSYTEESEYDIVMANPPFTGSIDKGDINENLQLGTTKTELLFVENIYRLLKKGGTVGKMCVAYMSGQPAIISTNLIRLRLGAELRPLHFVSLMLHCKGRVGRLKTGADGAFTHMNTGVLDSLEFRYPSLKLQDKYGELASKIDSVRSHYQKSLIELENLYAALSQKAFKGELDLSRVPLPHSHYEETNAVATEHSLVPAEPGITINLPNPDNLLDALENVGARKILISNWLEAYLIQLGSTSFSVPHFMGIVQSQLAELHPDIDFEPGANDYEHIKTWVFEALASHKIMQTFDDVANHILLKGAQASRVQHARGIDQ